MTGIMPKCAKLVRKKKRRREKQRKREREKKEITGTCNCDRSICQKRKRSNTKQKVPRKLRENPESQYLAEPPCATTSHKRPPGKNTKIFPVKALQLEPLVNDNPL